MVVKNTEPVAAKNEKKTLSFEKKRQTHEECNTNGIHSNKTAQPDLKVTLESGQIPTAAMIHAARKSRQKAREMGMYYTSHKIFTVEVPLLIKASLKHEQLNIHCNQSIAPNRRFFI